MRVSKSLASSFYTYALGKDLYIPLTSRCNTRTLPETRGPNFTLPAPVVASLCRVRDAEQGVQQWAPWCMYLDSQETPQKLPPPLEATKELLPPPPSLNPGAAAAAASEERLPSIQDLFWEIQEQVASSAKKGNKWNSIVFAGEGEPTMRLEDLLALAELLRNNIGTSSTTVPCPQLRLTTNGLIVPSTTTTTVASSSSSYDNIPQRLHDSGITKVSVALMTADPQQYQDLMMPLVDSAHLRVCNFIQQAVAVPGLDVETTAVERQGVVDKQATEALSDSLLVTNPVRWRPYFG
jgi:hypothetical protein